MIKFINENHRFENNQFEIVERKGLGHPDTLCDAIAETASREYSKYFMDNFNKLAHHWFDKVMLVGGQAEIKYGYGALVSPYKLIFAGKAVSKVGPIDIPITQIFRNSAFEILNNTLSNFNFEKDLILENIVSDGRGPTNLKTRYTPNSIEDLVSISSLNGDNNLQISNDCNICCAYFPKSTLENMVYDIENYLNGNTIKEKYPFIGCDIKVLGVRKLNNYKILVNVPFIANLIYSRIDYLNAKSIVEDLINKFIYANFNLNFELIVNPHKDSYLTVTGSVADTGDVGVVGRGNRINGLITPFRSMSIEAPAGKNPIDHTGKLYSILANEISVDFYELTKRPVNTIVTSSKDSDLTKPDEILLKYEGDILDEKLLDEFMAHINNKVSNIHNITYKLVNNGITMW